MVKTDFRTIDEYHSTLSGESLERMNKLVNKLAPEPKEVLNYKTARQGLTSISIEKTSRK